MTIYAHGGDLAGYIVSAGVDNVVTFAPGAVIKGWNAQSGGEQVTDLANADGGPVTEIVASDGTDGYGVGALPRFRAPLKALWLGQDGQPRVLSVTTDMPELLDQVAANVAAAVTQAEAAAAAAAELAASSSVTGHEAAADPHGQYHTDARGDARYQLARPAPSGPLAEPLFVYRFTSTPDSTDSDMWQVYVTHSGVERLVTWRNERGYHRAEQVAGALWDAPYAAITAHNGQGRAFQVQQRGADNVRRDVGGIDKDGRVVTSDQAWAAMGTVDPGATGRYSALIDPNVDTLGVRFDTNDLCRLRGRISVAAAGTTGGHVLCNLPAGYAPGKQRMLGAATSGGALVTIEIMPAGTIVARRTIAGAFDLALDDLTYRK